MLEYRIRKNGVATSIFLLGNRGNVILAPGLPQHLDKHHPFVQQMCRLGLNLFVPNYPGTFDSDGPFSVSSAAKAIENTIKLAKSGQAVELYNQSIIEWDTRINYVVGFSFGALPVLLQPQAVDKNILICPFVSYKFHDGSVANAENISQTFDFLKRAYPKTYRLEKQALIKELLKIPLPEKKNNLFAFYSSNDPAIPQEEVDFLRNCYDCKTFDKLGGHSITIRDEELCRILLK